MKKIRFILQIMNVLSVDVALGAISSALFFAEVLQVQLQAQDVAVLGLAVWIIYTADHLLDARSVPGVASTYRHQFHQQHFKKIVVALCAAILTTGVLLFFIHKQLFFSGLFLSICVFLYLLTQRFTNGLKELAISVLYTAGVVLPAIVAAGLPFSELPWLLVVQFMLTALVNLLVFSLFDAARDVADGATSFATLTGTKVTECVLWVVFVIICLLTVLSRHSSFAVVNAVAGIQVVVLLLKKMTTRNDVYRLAGDAAFMLPGVFVLF